ncbi:MAG: 4-hydroxy-tetrahydrodipicolinate synthase, partial [Saprospiraceae bacterium]|nr:4-hydroxy-tetrahydrodipicolinate synthase [Saprospiraceae bacterium]
LGTTAETATLTAMEEIMIIEKTKEINGGRVPLVLGNLGGNNTQVLLDKFDKIDFDGVDAILSVSPYYNKPSQRGIFEHYSELARKSPVPIIIYNVPSRTASRIETDTIVRLAKTHEKIGGVKDATGDMVEATKMAKSVDSDFIMLSGDDPTTLPFMACGGHGVISVIANAFPGLFTEMVSYAREGNYSQALVIHQKLIELHYWLYVEGNPVGIKSCLSSLGFCTPEVRLPLVEASEITRKGIAKELEKIKKY